MTKILTIGLLTAVSLSVSAQPNSFNGPVPSANQLRWQDMEMYAFIHYSLNTYTDQEWGFGHHRIICFPTVTTTQLRFTVIDTKARVIKLDADRLAEGERMGYCDIEFI